ncbi:aldehyde dehydrogenase family protein [Candidatus Daviesbacteria bacterium]|nr:aldehyde dehydrogenase family protein [Candidatus Daviesbacteria bacterium]
MYQVIGKNYINGQWVELKNHFYSLNPSNTNEDIGIFPQSVYSEVDLAVEAAKDAFRSWKSLSRINRAEYFNAFVKNVEKNFDELVHLMCRESGKQINECKADVIEGIHMAQYNFGRARMPYGEVMASEIASKDAFMLRKPKGVIAAITPWNFPFAIPLWLIIPSLLEGNTVVFKPSEDTPAVGEFLVKMFDEVSLPPGVLNLVQGDGGTGWDLVTNTDIKVVLFTGSYAVGSKIRKECAGSIDKMAVCEMGGKNAIIVLEDADLDLAVNACILSAFKTAGQRCVSASRLIVHRSILKEFEDKFVNKAKNLIVGDPLDSSTFMGPVINLEAINKILSYNDMARKEGVEILLNGSRLVEGKYWDGYFMSPFVYETENRFSKVLKEEVFGPHVAIIPFDTLEDAVSLYNSTDYGFALAVISNDYRKIKYLQQNCDFGVGYVNLPSIGAEVHLPFGGTKKSGSGMPSASALIDAVTHRVAWTVNYADEIQLAQGLNAKV